MVPGAGHMYLGLTRQGIQLMLLFFFTFFISTSLDLELIAILLPVIWFYSIFDVRQKVTSEEPLIDSDLKIFSNITSCEGFIKKNTAYKYIGYGFIFIGIATLVNNLAFPLISEYLDYHIIRLIRPAFSSLILIIIGSLLLKSKNNVLVKRGDESICKDVE